MAFAAPPPQEIPAELLRIARACPRWFLPVRSPDIIRPSVSDPTQMLADAIAKARKLVGDLERQQAELSADPSRLPPEQFEAGRQAFEQAVSTARRVLASLEKAEATRPEGR